MQIQLYQGYYIPPDNSHFTCSKGVPQGMSSSSVFFWIYLDDILKKTNLLNCCFKVHAYINDIAIQTHLKTKLCKTLNMVKELE